MCINLAWNAPGAACRANATTEQAWLEAWAEALQEHDAMEQPASTGHAQKEEHASEH